MENNNEKIEIQPEAINMDINEKIEIQPEAVNMDTNEKIEIQKEAANKKCIDEAAIRKLAERIYDFDAEVYKITGSNLGRVYNGDRERNIIYIENLIATGDREYVLRQEVALIGNMAKSITDPDKHTEALEKFAKLLRTIKETQVAPDSNDIIDVSRTKIDKLPIGERYEKMDNKIICISRTFGSGGSEIGFILAGALGINYYDVEIFNELSKRLDFAQGKKMDDVNFYSKNENGAPVYSGKAFEYEHRSFKTTMAEVKKFHGLPKEDALFFQQSELIVEMAKRESFVVMGRCADAILKAARIPHISIFISASFANRVKRLENVYRDVPRAKIKSMVRKNDNSRKRKYGRFTGGTWGELTNYDITINSENFGIDGSVDVIMQLLNQKSMVDK